MGLLKQNFLNESNLPLYMPFTVLESCRQERRYLLHRRFVFHSVFRVWFSIREGLNCSRNWSLITTLLSISYDFFTHSGHTRYYHFSHVNLDFFLQIDHIMFPEVPIALRMSGHLLLGVVRIYSMKVDYLFKDCDGVMVGINWAFPFPKVNLPENATRAPFESITLPQNFELDSLNFEQHLNSPG